MRKCNGLKIKTVKKGESVCIVQADQFAAIDTIGVLCIVLKILKLDIVSSFKERR